MHGFVLMKLLNVNAILHDIVALFSGKINFIDFNENSFNVFYGYSLLTPTGTGYEIFVDNNGRLIVGILTKKEYFATSVSSPLLIDKK